MGSREGRIRQFAAQIGLTPDEYHAQIAAGQKWCTTCRSWKSVTLFGVDRSRYDGRTAMCVACRYQRKTSGPSKSERKQQRALGLAWCRGCEAWLPLAKVRGGACNAHHAARARELYASDPIYRQKRRQHTHSRQRGVDPVPSEGATTIFEDFDGACAYCGEPATTWDHIVPVSKGGQTLPWNIVPACVSCNSSKRERDLFEWAQATGKTISQRVLDRMDLEWVSAH